MLTSSLREVGHRVTRNNQRCIGLTTSKCIRCRVLARIESRIATGQINPKRITGPPGDYIVRTRHIAMSAICINNKPGMSIHIARECQQRLRVGMLAPRHRQSHPEENNAKLTGFHAIHQVLPGSERNTGVPLYQISIERNTAGESP